MVPTVYCKQERGLRSEDEDEEERDEDDILFPFGDAEVAGIVLPAVAWCAFACCTCAAEGRGGGFFTKSEARIYV